MKPKSFSWFALLIAVLILSVPAPGFAFLGWGSSDIPVLIHNAMEATVQFNHGKLDAGGTMVIMVPNKGGFVGFTDRVAIFKSPVSGKKEEFKLPDVNLGVRQYSKQEAKELRAMLAAKKFKDIPSITFGGVVQQGRIVNHAPVPSVVEVSTGGRFELGPGQVSWRMISAVPPYVRVTVGFPGSTNIVVDFIQPINDVPGDCVIGSHKVDFFIAITGARLQEAMDEEARLRRIRRMRTK